MNKRLSLGPVEILNDSRGNFPTWVRQFKVLKKPAGKTILCYYYWQPQVCWQLGQQLPTLAAGMESCWMVSLFNFSFFMASFLSLCVLPLQ